MTAPTMQLHTAVRLATEQQRPLRSPAHWLILAYLAGDNDLEHSLLEDLGEMERVGSRAGSVEILAQIDRGPTKDPARGRWQNTRRYYVTQAPARSRILADLGPTNTGDPAVLESFIRFGAERYPAAATALILSNHGSGVYVPPEMNTHGRSARRHRRPLFHTTRERLTTHVVEARGIAYDDTAGDCLDNMEFKRVLAAAHDQLGRPVDLVGMDACLMTMLEVAYQIRDHAKILVGSQALEPGPGWPHDTILGDLVRRPDMTPATLARTIVTHYADAYHGGQDDATQSAIDLARLDDLVEAVDQLAATLLKALPNDRLSAAITGAWRRSLKFFDNTYVDLHDFVARHARGLSIYFPPLHDPSVYYRELDFARRTRWADFLEAFLGKEEA